MLIQWSQWIELFTDKMYTWWLRFIKIIPNLVLAVVVILFFLYLAHLTRRIIFKIIKAYSGKESISGLFGTISFSVIIFVGVSIALSILNLDQALSSLMAGAGILGLILGFAFQDLSSNFVSGVFIALKKPFEKGHVVETNGYQGIIEEIQIRTTVIRTLQGLHLMIPNRDIMQRPLINYSLAADRRIEVNFVISLHNDMPKVLKTAKDALLSIEYRHREKEPEVYLSSVRDNVVIVACWFWIYNLLPPGHLVAQSDVIQKLNKAFHDEKVIML